MTNTMNTEALIRELRNSRLFAECPCGGEFRLSQVILFDGTKPFPPEAVFVRERLTQDYEEQKEELEHKRHVARTRPEISARASNIGKGLEKIGSSPNLGT